MEKLRNARAGETGDPRDNPLISDIVRHDSHVLKSGSDPTWNRTRVPITTQDDYFPYPFFVLQGAAGMRCLKKHLTNLAKHHKRFAQPTKHAPALAHHNTSYSNPQAEDIVLTKDIGCLWIQQHTIIAPTSTLAAPLNIQTSTQEKRGYSPHHLGFPLLLPHSPRHKKQYTH
ncbi:hypothetical protein PR048_027187 [Dryococelus australis]|uniref:Uncharacterized protein n=1 Tax=Dryococelus australis TaxID=614101 RepID=A0ABQ9GGK9_9NEOP|nr:hypothetical protein PR048_027187 [Dryococelus australis]